MTEQLTSEKIEGFLVRLAEKGRGESSLKSYRAVLEQLFHWLPKEKRLSEETGPAWRAWLLEQGLSPVTVNTRISIWNGFVQYLGRKEWQLEKFRLAPSAPQPELTRGEYLRMLSAAKLMDRETSYLLIKVLGGAGVRVQELSQVTVEAVRQGAVKLAHHNGRQKRLLRIPELLRGELLGYIERAGLDSGPVFLTPAGKAMPRSRVYYYVNLVSRAAQVPEEKANPRCLWKMYESTQAGIRANIAVLTEQSYQRMLEEEQLAVGWNA